MPTVPPITQNFARPSYRPEATAGVDPDMRRMAIVASGFGAALALVIGAFSLSHHVHHGVPVIQPPTGPVRVKPADPGGMTVAGGEDEVSGAERLSPPAEQPALHALRAKARAHAEKAPASVASVELPPSRAAAIAPAAPVQHASITEPAASADQHGTVVQIGAFDSEQAAAQDWGKAAEHMPSLFDGHRPQVERAELAGHTIWRLRTGGFANLAAATDFCEKVRAKGGDCSIAAF